MLNVKRKAQNRTNQITKIKGAATLPLVLLIGGLIVEIGITGVFLAYFISQSSLGVKLSEQALAVARAGIQDAKIKIIRNKDFQTSNYTLNVENNSAQITVCKNFKTDLTPCDTPMDKKYEITSLGIVSTKQRKIQTILYVDPTTGKAELESEKEIEIQ